MELKRCSEEQSGMDAGSVEEAIAALKYRDFVSEVFIRT
jgi:hypothetical protein